MAPIISVIVPVYNTEKYVAECLESILKQSFEDIEVLLIDDGSTDRSPEICDEYAQSDTRIRVFHQKNQGVSASRNFGIREARGQYILFVDSDDCIAADMCAVLEESIRIFNSDVAISKFFRFIDEPNFQTTETVVREQLDTSEIADIFVLGRMNRIAYRDNPYLSYFSFITALYKKSIIVENNIFFHELKIGEDFLFSMKYLLQCKNAVLVSSYFYAYRNNGGSVMNSYKQNYLQNNQAYLELLNKVLEEQHIFDRYPKAKKCFEIEEAFLCIQTVKNELKAGKIKRNLLNIFSQQKDSLYSYSKGVKWKEKVYCFAIMYKCAFVINLIKSKQK